MQTIEDSLYKQLTHLMQPEHAGVLEDTIHVRRDPKFGSNKQQNYVTNI